MADDKTAAPVAALRAPLVDDLFADLMHWEDEDGWRCVHPDGHSILFWCFWQPVPTRDNPCEGCSNLKRHLTEALGEASVAGLRAGEQELDLAPIEAREAAAMKGPWRSMSAGNSTMQDGLHAHIAEVEGLQRPWNPVWVGWQAAKNHFKTFMREVDADFVAHARTDVPMLTAEIRRLRALLSERAK